MSDTLTISDAELDAMFSNVLPCDKCKAPAGYMSRGHRCRPPGFRAFKCQDCCAKWVAKVEKILASSPGLCSSCGERVDTISDLSTYHPI